jgi:outer membrane biogenesis lipoprotein LolB
MKFTVSAAAVALLAACSVNAVAAPEPVITPQVERRQGEWHPLLPVEMLIH